MPVITVTPGEILQSKTIEAGIYPAEMTKYEGPKASSSGKGVNLWVTFRITDGPAIDKELTVCLATGVREASLLGSMKFMPMAQLAFIQAAVEGKETPDVVQHDIDIDQLMHSPLELVIAVNTPQGGGNLLNTIERFVPSGYGAKAGSVF